MHGGIGSGAPRGNRNALRHGAYTREAIAEYRRLRTLIKQSRKLLCKLVAFELAVVACRFDGALKQKTRRLSGGGEAARLWPR